MMKIIMLLWLLFLVVVVVFSFYILSTDTYIHVQWFLILTNGTVCVQMVILLFGLHSSMFPTAGWR